jgi:hypothetical protein
MDKIKIRYRKLSELKKAEYNAKDIDREQYKQLKQSIGKFGFIDPMLVNIHADRKDVIIGGHQRYDVAKELGIEEVPTVELELTLEKEKELNLRLTKNQGRFVMDLVQEYFERDLLIDVGFSDKEIGSILDDYDKKLNSITDADAEMPIVAKYNEKYHSILIFVTNEVDLNWIRNVLKLGREKDYKSQTIGQTYVLTAQKFMELWNQKQGGDHGFESALSK